MRDLTLAGGQKDPNRMRPEFRFKVIAQVSIPKILQFWDKSSRDSGAQNMLDAKKDRNE